jgi:16S rRNA (adenine1518-N6/adenine1519-N6)-dimethyltransferase
MPFRKKKSLGQHFLSSTRIASNIAEAAALTKNDTVLEVGPGTGILTRELLARAGRVIAIEKDDRLIAPLSKEFHQDIERGTLLLLHDDILETDLSRLPLAQGGYSVVANIPYYITGTVIRLFLEAPTFPKRMVLLLQKEVAERIVAKKQKPFGSALGKESLLSLSVKAYGKPAIIRVVKRGSFSPPPTVDSAILLIDKISKNNFSDVSETTFFNLLRGGFAHKRKRLLGNLKGYAPEKCLREAFLMLSLPDTVRAEDVSLSTWFGLATLLKNDCRVTP